MTPFSNRLETPFLSLLPLWLMGIWHAQGSLWSWSDSTTLCSAQQPSTCSFFSYKPTRSTAARQLCLGKELPGFCSEICRTLKPRNDSFELEEGYLVFPPNMSVGLGKDMASFQTSPHLQSHTILAARTIKTTFSFIFSISSPLNYMLTFSLLAEEQHISQYCCPHVGHVAWCWRIYLEQCVVDFTCSQVQRAKVAAASKGLVHTRVEHFESKRGNCECFEGSGYKDFPWLQLHAKLGHLSRTKEPKG